MSPVIAGVKYPIPAPRWCPECRCQRRLSFRNERNLYRTVCNLCRKPTISNYSPDSPYRVYCKDCWWGDEWDATAYGRDYNPTRSFFEQFAELLQSTPQLALVNANNENSEFANQTANLKDCYLLFACADSRDCYYGMRMNRDTNCVDCLIVEGSELAYECSTSQDLYNSAFCINCSNCSESRFLFDCIGCSNCLFSYNLRNQQYCIENRQYSKQEYEALAREILSGCRSHKLLQGFIEKFHALMKNQAVHEYARLRSTENCTGNYLYNCRDAHWSFESGDGDGVRYSVLTNFSKNISDVNNNYRGELIYEVCTAGLASYRVMFSVDIWPSSSDIAYSFVCPSSKSLFGCANLRQKENCILNKQYSRADYEKLVPQIIGNMQQRGEWGEFFPPKLSPFSYRDSVAFEHFPLTKEIALSQGCNWFDYTTAPPAVSRTVPAAELPDKIGDVTDSILDTAIQCQESNRPFRIIKPELEFYRTNGFPLPRLHPDLRHRDRMQQINPRKLWPRPCNNCQTPLESVYKAERAERVLCHECYLQAVHRPI